MMEDYQKEIPRYLWIAWIFSPFVLPIIIGMMLVIKSENKENE